ncbi:MAG TPA: glycerate kinase [Candidatus Enterocloster excrementigallinarum]|uniref:Glycerate kinase n=1 Tax=Candidatus Enterocloster excrementigallinarum TaxID=2838558 RepID=A0A9D2PRW3_9FIRM|nr:glycerate kinase [Candidatus Enterocloster excrementigallinarum]
MNITIAIDSFKGSLSSMEAGQAVAEGIRRVMPSAEIRIRPLADGGEGTTEALTAGLGGELKSLTVTGPLGRPVTASYGLIRERKMAVLEMASAAGLTLISQEERNPLEATTYGVGEMIRDAIGEGCRHFLVGIGGSATNDGGTGMLSALGFQFLDSEGQPIPLGAKGLENLARISAENARPELSQCSFHIACDVTNPLCGENGCSAVYGPQKGADPEMIRQMDHWMERYGDLAARTFPAADKEAPGAGAAGGLGFAFLTFLNGSLESGVGMVLKEINLKDDIRDADLVITGEGRLDAQTVMGKAPIGVAHLAKEYGKPVIAFSGAVTREAGLCNQHGIDAFFPIMRGVVSLQEALDPGEARINAADTAEQVFRLIQLKLSC